MTAPADPRVDQAVAAEAEAAAVFGGFADQVSRHNGGGATRRRPGVVPPLVQTFADRQNAAVAAGRGKACAHWQPGRPTQPYIMAAWMPGVVSCTRDACTAVFLLLDEEANRTCDGCGAVGQVGVKPAMVQSEAYIMLAGVCADCRPAFLGP